MKKITLFAIALFAFSNSVTASEAIVSMRAISVAEAEPIVFMERGVEFFVFPDGQFDFNTKPAATGSLYYKNTGRASLNRAHGAPGVQVVNRGVRVEHDEFGRVRRVGNVFINYDAHDRIKRIGSVYMTYNRFALSQVGGLRIKYNNRGYITGFSGSVNGYQPSAYTPGNYVGNSDYSDSNDSVDQDYYYYKSDGTKDKIPVRK